MVNLLLSNKTSPDSTLTVFLTEDKVMHCKIGNKHFDVNLKEYLNGTEKNFRFISATFDTQKSATKTKKPNLRDICLNISHELGFNVRSKGTHFLIEAVIYLYENNIDFVDMRKLYIAVAKNFSLEPKDIREPLRKSVKKMTENFNYENSKKYFIQTLNECPITPRTVIIQIVYYLRKKYPPAQYSKERIDKILYSLY